MSFSELLSVSSKDAVKAFERAGWRVARQSGSHITLVKKETDVILTVPERRELRKGTLPQLLKLADLTAQEFKRLL